MVFGHNVSQASWPKIVLDNDDESLPKSHGRCRPYERTALYFDRKDKFCKLNEFIKRLDKIKHK